MNYPKADTGKRMVAAILDNIVASFLFVMVYFVLGFLPGLGWLFHFVAGVIFLFYLTFKDALPVPALQGASPGKKMLGMKAIKSDGGNCNYLASFKRNLPFVLPTVVALLISSIPFFGLALGAIFGPLIAIISLLIVIVELARVLTEERGLRFGDMFADTQVVEFRHLS